MTVEEIIADLQVRLPPKRFYHSMGTAHTALRLAIRHGVDSDKATLAALLHDCARRHSRKKQWDLVEELKLPQALAARDYPSIWHQWLAPELARRRYGVEDEEILAAIGSHATGAPDMSPLAEVVFVADCIEPTRTRPAVSALREAAWGRLRDAVAACLEMKRDHVIATGRLFHAAATAACEFYGVADKKA